MITSSQRGVLPFPTCHLLFCFLLFTLCLLVSANASHSVSKSRMATSAMQKKAWRQKRDESEHHGRAFGRGIGFFVGEPCLEQCNAILFHIYCNRSTQKCECQPSHPVNIDNRVCVRGLKLGEPCQYDESCSHSDANALCHAVERKCRCQEQYHPMMVMENPECVLGRAVFAKSHFVSSLTTFAGVVLALLSLFLLIWTTLKRLSKPQMDPSVTGDFTDPMARTSADRSVQGGKPTSDRPLNINAIDVDPGFVSNSPTSRRTPYSLLAPPLVDASRRTSGSETPISLRSYSSFRSQASFRRYRTSDINRSLGFGHTDTSPGPSPTNHCNHLSLGDCHPLHVSRKTSPVDNVVQKQPSPSCVV